MRFQLADCKSQRNLNDEGRNQALRIGTWLKQQGVASAQVYASPWCRCKDTAGSVIEKAILDAGDNIAPKELAAIFNALRRSGDHISLTIYSTSIALRFIFMNFTIVLKLLS